MVAWAAPAFMLIHIVVAGYDGAEYERIDYPSFEACASNLEQISLNVRENLMPARLWKSAFSTRLGYAIEVHSDSDEYETHVECRNYQ